MQELWMPSPHYSTSRGPYNKIVLHTTEGAMTIEALGNWFANPSAGCSSHHGADQYKRTLGAYVYENHKAWTQGNANPYCLSLEMCAYASWSESTWRSKPVLLDNAAEWIRYCVDKYGIPWTMLSNAQAQDPNVRGICQHVNFGSWGSGHHDCGSGFPMSYVIDMARNWGGAPPQPQPQTGGDVCISSAVDPDGGVHYAGLDENGSVIYFPPGWANWGQIDPGQSGAISGTGISIDKNWWVELTYTNGSKKPCKYRKKFREGAWAWSGIGDINAR
jgi:hypothetical protein